MALVPTVQIQWKIEGWLLLLVLLRSLLCHRHHGVNLHYMCLAIENPIMIVCCGGENKG